MHRSFPGQFRNSLQVFQLGRGSGCSAKPHLGAPELIGGSDPRHQGSWIAPFPQHETQDLNRRPVVFGQKRPQILKHGGERGRKGACQLHLRRRRSAESRGFRHGQFQLLRTIGEDEIRRPAAVSRQDRDEVSGGEEWPAAIRTPGSDVTERSVPERHTEFLRRHAHRSRRAWLGENREYRSRVVRRNFEGTPQVDEAGLFREGSEAVVASVVCSLEGLLTLFDGVANALLCFVQVSGDLEFLQ